MMAKIKLDLHDIFNKGRCIAEEDAMAFHCCRMPPPRRERHAQVY